MQPKPPTKPNLDGLERKWADRWARSGVYRFDRTRPRSEVFTLAESLGGVESLIELPGEMTHASVAGTEAEVPADLVRLSVGIEHPDDLVADLARALEQA